ncbi:hypothetical protein ACSBR2_016577 [Camellia fascicularis]
MTEKGATPFTPVEPSMAQFDELQRKKRLRRFAFIVIFALFALIVTILVFALVTMRVKTPRVEIRSVNVEGLYVGNSTYNMTLIAQIEIKNKNFGDYKYDRTTMSISHGGVIVGDGVIWKGNVKARDTYRMTVTTKVSSSGLLDASRLSSDISSGVLMLNSEARLKGKVYLMKIWGIELQFVKKRKSAEMNCIMELNLTSGVIQNMDCDH